VKQILTPVNRTLKSATYVLAVVYFIVDAVFMAVARPISNWLARRRVFRKLRIWIRSLPPYPSLALFSVPVILLEPIKPVAAYLAATGQLLGSALTFVVGELLKVVLVERLFRLTRDKLMKIPAFAWAYGKFLQAKAWLEATELWRILRSMRSLVRDCIARIKAALASRFARLQRKKKPELRFESRR
jgi:hypothetical protein